MNGGCRFAYEGNLPATIVQCRPGRVPEDSIRMRDRVLVEMAMGGVFLGTSLFVLASAEAGYRLARSRRFGRGEKPEPAGKIAEATLAFFAFLLAFTFGIAEDAYNARRAAMVQEAGAIRLTYLLSSVLPAAQGTEIRTVLRQYVDQRLRWDNGVADPPGNSAEALLARLWRAAAVAGEQHPGEVDVFLSQVTQVIELEHERLLLREQNRIPLEFWFVVGLLTFLTAFAVGYHSGVAETNRSPALVALAFALAAVIVVIVDLDRPGTGLIAVSERPMIDLRAALQQSAP